jgi:aerobic-type carbon monoxide dehydrogenase small subunit (CoxS/CutS family)
MTDRPHSGSDSGSHGNSGAWQPVPGGGDYDPDQTMHVSFAAQLPPEPLPGEDPLSAHGPAGPPGEADPVTTWSIPVIRDDGDSDSGEYSTGVYPSSWDQAPSPAAPTQGFAAGMFGQGAAAAQAARAQGRSAPADTGHATPHDTHHVGGQDAGGHSLRPAPGAGPQDAYSGAWTPAYGGPQGGDAVPWLPSSAPAADAAWSSVVDDPEQPQGALNEQSARNEQRALNEQSALDDLPGERFSAEAEFGYDTGHDPLSRHGGQEDTAHGGPAEPTGALGAGPGPDPLDSGGHDPGSQDPGPYGHDLPAHGPDGYGEHPGDPDPDGPHEPQDPRDVDHPDGEHAEDQGGPGHDTAPPADGLHGEDPLGGDAYEAAGLDGSYDGNGYDPAVPDGEAGEAGEPPAAPVEETRSEHPLASYMLRVNGAERPVTDAWLGESLLYVLRERLGLAGAKDGCEQGECGACSVQVDGRLVASCLVPAATAAGSEVRTVEGLTVDGRPSDVQQALAECGAVQCGFCIPGMAMTVHDLLEGNHRPTDLDVRQALSGNLCRCSGYRGVLDAVRQVVTDRGAADETAADDPPSRVPHQGGPATPEADQ